MSVALWPPPSAVLPHRPPMVLLTRIVSHDDVRTVCAVDITTTTLFLTPAHVVRAYVGIEYMAQCVAAHAGLAAQARGEAVKLGLLIGARRVDLHTASFPLGQTLLVSALHIWGDRSLASFECSVMEAVASTLLLQGTLSVYSPPDAAALLAGR